MDIARQPLEDVFGGLSADFIGCFTIGSWHRRTACQRLWLYSSPTVKGGYVQDPFAFPPGSGIQVEQFRHFDG